MADKIYRVTWDERAMAWGEVQASSKAEAKRRVQEDRPSVINVHRTKPSRSAIRVEEK